MARASDISPLFPHFSPLLFFFVLSRRLYSHLPFHPHRLPSFSSSSFLLYSQKSLVDCRLPGPVRWIASFGFDYSAQASYPWNLVPLLRGFKLPSLSAPAVFACLKEVIKIDSISTRLAKVSFLKGNRLLIKISLSPATCCSTITSKTRISLIALLFKRFSTRKMSFRGFMKSWNPILILFFRKNKKFQYFSAQNLRYSYGIAAS